MVKRKLLAKLMTLIESYLIWDRKTHSNGTHVGVQETHKKSLPFKKPEKKQKIMNHPRINNADRLRRMKNNEKLKIGKFSEKLKKLLWFFLVDLSIIFRVKKFTSFSNPAKFKN